jgi:hypothetical protein
MAMPPSAPTPVAAVEARKRRREIRMVMQISPNGERRMTGSVASDPETTVTARRTRHHDDFSEQKANLSHKRHIGRKSAPMRPISPIVLPPTPN